MSTKVYERKSVRWNYRLAVLALFLCVFSGAKGQQNFNQDGLYYIAGPGYSSSSTTSNFYLCPTENWNYYKESSPYFTSTENGMPFMTTYNCRDGVYNSDKSVWYIKKKAGTDYYYIIRVYDGKKLTFNRGMLNSNGTSNNPTVNQGRMRLHLEASPADDDDALFEIIYVSSKTCYDIKTKKAGADNVNRKFLNVTQGNQSSLQATHDKYDGPDGMDVGGIIGLWTGGSSNDNNSKWYFEQPDTQPDGSTAALCKAPNITNTSVGVYTISSPLNLPSGYKIRYTLDSSITPGPDNGLEYTNQITISQSQSGSHLRAWVVAEFFDESIIVTKIADEIVYAGIPNPSFEVLCENELQITCPASDAVIYYTINDPNPSSSNGTQYDEPFTDDLNDGDYVYAIAYIGGDASGVESYHYLTNNQPPTLSFDPSDATRIKVEFAEGQKIHYTISGTHPDPTAPGEEGESGASGRFFYITGSGIDDAHDVHVCVITTSTDPTDGHGPSCPVTEIRRPKKPTIKTNDVCNGNGELIQTMELTGITDQDIGAGKTYWYALSNGEGQTAPALNTFTQYTRNSVLSIMDIATAYDWNGSVMVTLHAYAKDAAGNPSVIVSKNYLLKHTAAPTIAYVPGDSEATITAVNGAKIYYSVDGHPYEATTSATIPVASGDFFTIIASARLVSEGEGESCEVTKIVRWPEPISSLADIDDPNGAYDLTANIDDASTFTGFSFGDFAGSLNGNGHTISNLHVPLFDVIDGGTVNNLFFDNVSINITAEGDVNVGTICGKAMGASRIYNCGVLATNSIVTTDEDGYTKITGCSSTISGSSNSGSSNVGGLVGLLDGSSRVINCFSYANVSGGSYVGGIVGYNYVATTATNLQTMVMNCMFYGEVSGTSIAPIYNGEIITNVGNNTGVSNFNYFRLESDYIQNTDITKVYHCALGAETRFLQRFEFYRHLLNSNRALAAWWVTGDRDNKNEMMKWVLEPTQIGSSTPYPILKTPGKYPSVVNYDAEHALENQPRNQGGKLGTLSVTIQMGSGGAQFGPPTGAEITTSSLTLPILDKDTTHFNYNYYKVQLPYYNDVGTKNYNGNRVVTGWKIVSIEGGTAGSYSTGEDVTYTNGVLTATPYNFADRNCTAKDLYSGETANDHSGRVFNQGAYWDVPYGVTAITIEPYWAKCVYLADAFADVVYNQNMSTAYNVPNVGGGQQYTNRNSYPIAGESQMVFTSKGDAIATSNYGLFQNETGSGDCTVYDYAVVLVGNYHYYGSLDADMSEPYTVTSIDLDGDNEPDYSYILRFDSRKAVHPVRVDFINIPGLGMAQKSTGGTGTYNFGIMQPKGWFESTNTSLFRETQFEYDNSARIAAPYILQGGVMEQWVNGQSGGHANLTTYFHVGGNVWFKEFHRGTHQDQQYDANHSPVSVTGGDFDQFHLTGLYRADATIRDDNAECYITGGRFGVVAGTGMDGLGTSNGKGNITWIIDNADIKEFYAGSFNADRPAQGNLHTIVNGGHIDLFCGGPKFGDMSTGKTVTTIATGCTFGTFFGAGYGGNSYSRQAPRNHNNIINFPHNDTGNPSAGNDASWNAWLNRFYTQSYNSAFGGVSTQFNYQFIPMSGNADNCARIFVEYVKFSLATTHRVTDTLTGCTITGNFYGGGSLGKVEGDVSSVLDSCIVKGNVYGAGQAATLPTIEVDDIDGFLVEPYYYTDLGTYRRGVKRPTTPYKWESFEPGSSPTNPVDIDKEHHILYTSEDLNKTELGSVKGNVKLTIQGNSTVFGNVYGGGEESMVVRPVNTVVGNTEVQILGKTKVFGNIYGGGNMGEVEGNTKVIVNSSNVNSGN